MDFKSIFLTIAVCIHIIRKYRVQSEFLDIVLQFNDSNQSNYTRFINVTQQQFLWLSSALCDNNTYSYSITYDRDNGYVVSNSSTTFMAQDVDIGNYLQKFTCTSTSTVFQCTRLPDAIHCDDVNLSWLYLNTDTSSTCPEKCVTMCPSYPIQSILFTFKTQTLKNLSNGKCTNAITHQISTLKSTESNQRTTSAITSRNQTEDYISDMSNESDQGVPFYVVIILVFIIFLLLIAVAFLVFKYKLKFPEKWNNFRKGARENKQRSKINESDTSRMSSNANTDENSTGYSQYQQISDVVPVIPEVSSQSTTLFVNDINNAQPSNYGNNNVSVVYENSIEHLENTKPSSGNINNYDSLNLHQKTANVYLTPTC